MARNPKTSTNDMNGNKKLVGVILYNSKLTPYGVEREVRKMDAQFILEIVDHKNGNIIGSDKGTAYYLSQVLQSRLENMTDDCKVIINKV